jgi:hypothetical protein
VQGGAARCAAARRPRARLAASGVDGGLTAVLAREARREAMLAGGGEEDSNERGRHELCLRHVV